MNVKRTFRKLVLVQVLLGIVAFSLATKNPTLLIIGGLMAALAWTMVETPKGKPLPQWAINLAAVGAIVWLLYELMWDRSRMPMAMGRFTVCVQVAVMFGPKRYREYALMLVLSVIQIIGASVVSETMVFGTLLALYCLTMLFTILMMHLSATSDRVQDANRGATPKGARFKPMPGATGRWHRWHFRLTAVLVAVACAGAAVVVFVAMPRHEMPGLRRQMNRIGLGRRVGFSETVSLHGAPDMGGSDEIVMTLKVKFRGKNAGGVGTSWLVRGAALDHYDQVRRVWRRSEIISSVDDNIPMNPIMRTFAKLPGEQPYWEAHFTQRLKDTRTLFSLHPVGSMSSRSLRSIRFNAIDQQLTSNAPLRGVNQYVQHIPTEPVEEHFNAYFQRSGARLSRGTTLIGQYQYSVGSKHRQIRVESLRILREAGMSRSNAFSDLQKAKALANYLRNNFTYALTNDHFGLRQDPTSEFILRTRRGHCEMFASALAAMAREVNLPARLITGFRATEYNKVGQYYTIRQADAHAWTEVYCKGRGWVTFDATPGVPVAAEHAAPRHWYTPLLESYEHMELSWVQGFVSYDRGRRDRILEAVNVGFERMKEGFVAMLDDQTTFTGKVIATLRVFKDQWGLGWLTYSMIILISLNIVVIALIVMRRIARRMGWLDRLGLYMRRRAAGGAHQVRFYAAMSNLLARHGHEREASQSPLQFAQQMVNLDPMRYGAVMPLTVLFYEVHFGRRELSEQRQQRAGELLGQLKAAISRPA